MTGGGATGAAAGGLRLVVTPVLVVAVTDTCPYVVLLLFKGTDGTSVCG